MASPEMRSFPRTEKYSVKLADNIMTLRNERALMDFKLCIKDDTIPCSKFVMAAHSPILRAKLTSDMAEAAKQEIRLDHIDLGIIRIILDYMYCEDVSFHKDQLMALITATDYLQMTELKEMCLDEVPAILEPANVIAWWKEAVKMNFDTIKDRCEEIIAAKFNQISQQHDFLNLSVAEMQHFVSNVSKDSVKVDDVLDAIMRWVSYEEGQQTHLEDLLLKVQLTKCSAKCIKSALQTYETLLDHQPMMYKLLCNTLADISTGLEASCKTETQMVVVGGEDDFAANHVCWEVNEGLKDRFNIPCDNIIFQLSVCKTPLGFAITGGVGKDSCFVFVASTESWVKLHDMPCIRQCHGSICIKDALYTLGGYVRNENNPCDSVDFVDLASGVWQKGKSLPVVVKFPRVSDIDASVYLFDADDSKQLLQMNISEKVWRKLSSPPANKKYEGVSMTSALGQLFVAGGWDRVCAWYNPKTDTWCTGQQPLRKHKYGALGHNEGKLVLLGGSFEGGTDVLEEYNVVEAKWTVCNYTMPKKIHGHTAFMLNIQPRE